MKRLLAVLGLVLACGGAHAGGGCAFGSFACEDPHTALECETGTWRAIACKGPDGCADRNGQITCDASLDVAGDPCGLAQDGNAICSSDGGAVLQCRQGQWTEVRTCSCVSAGTQVACQ